MYIYGRAALLNPRIQKPQRDLVLNPIGVDRVHNVNPHRFSCRRELVSPLSIAHLECWLTFDLFDRSFEPLPGRDQPKRDRVQHNYTNGDDRVIECLRVDGVGLREDEDDRDKAYPQHCNGRNRVGELSKMEGSPHKVLAVPESEGNRNTIRDVQPDGRDTVKPGTVKYRPKLGWLISYLVAAANATLLPKLGSPRMKDSVQASQTVLMGDLVLGSTLWKNLCPGIPPSRAKAYIIRELDVMENMLAQGKLSATALHGDVETTHPQKYMHPTTITIKTMAPLWPTVSRKIWVTG